MLGISLTGQDLNIGSIRVPHALWLGGLVFLIAVGGIGLNMRRDARAWQLSVPRRATARNDA